MIEGDHIFDDQITVCTARGRLTFPEIKDKVIELSSGKVASCVLCDLTQATIADLTSIELEDILDLISRHVSDRGGKAAIITHSGVDYGLARMFGTFAEISGLPIKVKVFHTTEIAKAWLRDAETVTGLQPPHRF